MVLQKRLDYGFNGYQVPHIPRATRSARRSSTKKKVEDNKLCAFDLLATVAGNLLLENKSSSAYSNTSAYKYENSIVKNTVKQEQGEDESLKVGPSDNHNSSSVEFASVISTSDLSQNFDADKLVVDKTKNEMGSFASKLEVGMAGYRECVDCELEDEIKIPIKDTQVKTGKMPIGIRADMCCLEDPEVCDAGKPAALVSSDSSAKASLCKDHVVRGSLAPSRGDVKLVSRDDDENSSGCTHPRTTTRSFRPPPCHGDRRIRRLMASRCWKVAPKLKEEGFCNIDGDIKPVYRNRKNCYKRQRTQRIYPFKKRKFLYDSLASNSDSREKGGNVVKSGSDLKMCEATGTSSSIADERPSFQSKDSHVKLRIKSFRVPELFIEIPETATVGSLKRAVMEAVTALLGDDLHVGVILQGKKVRDDNKTLAQTGISRNNLMDALGFTLEPNPLQTPPSICRMDSPFLLPCDIPQHLTRYSASLTEVHQGTDDSLQKTPTAKICNFVQSDNDSAPSPTDMVVDENTTDSKSLVAVPAVSVEALAVVPVHCTSKRSEIVQRRIRRPFSVTEVEALVQAVEKLGTGRWRDVKLCAFDNAKHRTYVDLKDKWKTLVHTARISPQQRRGEPVPQELLDRVLTAHSYWSQQQAKQQLKQPEICFLG